MNEKIGDRIKQLREKNGYTTVELGKIIGVYGTAISKYELGQVTNIPLKRIEALAKALGTTTEYLINGKIEKRIPKSNIEILDNKIINIPVYKSISAGYGATIDNTYMDINELEFIPIPEFPNWKYCFGVKVSGDSMHPLIPNGSIVIINTELAIDNNRIGAFCIDNESFLKRKKILNNSILLISENKEYEPIVVTDFNSFKEIGKVIKVIADFSQI